MDYHRCVCFKSSHSIRSWLIPISPPPIRTTKSRSFVDHVLLRRQFNGKIPIYKKGVDEITKKKKKRWKQTISAVYLRIFVFTERLTYNCIASIPLKRLRFHIVDLNKFFEVCAFELVTYSLTECHPTIRNWVHFACNFNENMLGNIEHGIRKYLEISIISMWIPIFFSNIESGHRVSTEFRQIESMVIVCISSGMVIYRIFNCWSSTLNVCSSFAFSAWALYASHIPN